MFPDKIKTTYTTLNPESKIPPRVIFGTTALRWIHALVDLHEHEVGFYAVVDERENYTFFIRNVFYPKHSEANGGTCEISPEGETEMMNWLCTHEMEDDVPKVRLWGHSHVNMGTGPSGQDEKQAMERMNSTRSFLIRIICNKIGEISLSFFDYNNKIRFDHVKWEVENDSDNSINDRKLDDIANTITAANMTTIEKIKKINEITIKDDQSNFIREKVKELKIANIPDKKSKYSDNSDYYFPYHKGKKNTQENLFQKKGTTSFDIEDELEEGFQNSINDLDCFDKEEVGKLLKSWEEKVGIK